MNRRGFLEAILAASVAPYVSTVAGVLMPVTPVRGVSTLEKLRHADRVLAAADIQVQYGDYVMHTGENPPPDAVAHLRAQIERVVPLADRGRVKWISLPPVLSSSDPLAQHGTLAWKYSPAPGTK